MKTLKELNEKCSLIAEFNNPAFICMDNEQSYKYYKSTKCRLYCNNKGKYYIYKCINKSEIHEYDKYEKAMDRFLTFINIVLTR